MGEWTGLAEDLATGIREPGFGAAAVIASAWCAGVDPGATRTLIGAVLALTDGDAMPRIWDRADPSEDEKTLLQWGEELESHIGDLLKRCLNLGSACRAEYGKALEARARALVNERKARAAMTIATDWGQKAALEDEMDYWRDEAAAAARVAADCEQALEILGAADGKLRYALDCVRSLPADLDETYEAAKRLVGNGGKLPFRGGFIAPGEPVQAARSAA
jgi:hypothetical protein